LRVKYALLSSTIVLEPGKFEVERITLYEARRWAKKQNPICFSTHDTVRVLGVEPAERRLACESYEEALCVKPKARLDFNRQYTEEEIAEIGVKCYLIKKL
jgi:hypothetical protein